MIIFKKARKILIEENFVKNSKIFWKKMDKYASILIEKMGNEVIN